MADRNNTYVYDRGERGIFAEIYFPRRVAAQGTIFNALKDGYQENVVRTYLEQNIEKLFDELHEYRHVFYPRAYTQKQRERTTPTIEDAKERINMYRSPFFGWSDYVVQGVFFGAGGAMIEEATQVIRLIFRFGSSFTDTAAKAHCSDVLRAMLARAIMRQSRIGGRAAWYKEEKAQFIRQHQPWPKPKIEFAEKYFEPIVKESVKWMEDCLLFVFGYMVRQFAENLSEAGHPEEEIWVTSFFNLTINVMRQLKPQRKEQEQ